ncbi:MAG: hypothetical protein IKG25_03315, partial [Mogibacterium sp.]|nr:hypothetical protein [Mogibacterium sp.]
MLKKRISRILSIFLVASMVLSYNSSFYLSVWAASEEAPAAEEEEMMADPAPADDAEDSGEVSETAQQTDQEEAVQQSDAVSEEEAEDTAGDAENSAGAAVQEDSEEESADTDKPVKDKYTYEDSRVKVTASLEDASAVPDDADLVVTPVTKDSKNYNYDAYMEALNRESGSAAAATEGRKGIFSKLFGGDEENVSAAYTEDNTLLYDIAFIVDGQEIQPAEGSVDVAIQFKDNQLSECLSISGKDDVRILHLPLKKSVQEDFATTADATEIEAADIQVEPVDAEVSVGKKETTSFTAETFSVWAWSNGAASTITIPEVEGTFGPDAPQYELNGPFGSLANFGVVGFSEIDQNDHLHSNFATKKYVLNTSAGFGLRGSKNGVTNTHKELYYIGESITGSAGSTNMEIHVPDSILLLGHDLGASGTLTGNANSNNYSINVGGKTINVTTGENGDKAAVQEGGVYVAKSIRQEPADSHYVDLDKMKEEAETLSNKLADRTASEVTVTPGENNVLIVESPDATIGCMNFNASDFAGKTLKIDEVHVANREHLLIINIDAAGADSITLPQLELSNTSEKYDGEVVQWTKGSVVVNVIDSTKPDRLFTGTVNTQAGLFQASILAPDAEVIVNASVNGQVFGDIVQLKNELHRDSITFTNSIPSVGGIRVAKTMNGSSIITPDTYSFTLQGLNYNGHQAPMPDGSNGNTKTVYAQADGLVTFGFLNFDEDEFDAGVRDYRYKVSEVIPAGATDIGDNHKLSGNISYDANEYIIEVHTRRGSSGGIGIEGYTIYDASENVLDEISYDAGKKGVVTFENATGGNSAKISLKVTKSFNGDTWPENGFSFQVAKKGIDEGSGIDMDPNKLSWAMPPFDWQIQNGAFHPIVNVTEGSPVAIFDQMEFQSAGTYYYTLKEIIPDGAEVSADGKTAVKDGIIYDNTEHEVVVTVREINGQKYASVKYDGNNSLTIANKVEKQTGYLVITKTVDGDNITESEFNGALKFTVQNADGKYLDKDGNLSDEKVELTLKDGGFVKGEDGKYTKTFENVAPGKYTVTETNSDVPGYTLVQDESTTEGEGTVVKDDTATVELKDVYTR